MPIIYFLIAALISFFGSMQPGPVNLTLLHSCVHGHYKRGLYIAIGGSIPELIYSFIALLFAEALAPYTQLLQTVSGYVALAFVVIGIAFFFIKSKANVEEVKERKSGFGSGFLVSIVNPQLILFWLGIIAAMNLQHVDLLHAGILSMFLFAIGTSVGAFLQHYFLIFMVQTYSGSNTVKLIKQYGNKLTGAMLILLGLAQWAMAL
ncbi:MAG: hypothetical protein CFE21_15880 [Bacteroidetes bacterium B1(2017)]|nr:MAG: hypothetical protein CFE21_15880 [Bacteroidetes bacterium B1(2017)]